MIEKQGLKDGNTWQKYEIQKYNNMMVVKGMFQVIYVLSVDFLSV